MCRALEATKFDRRKLHRRRRADCDSSDTGDRRGESPGKAGAATQIVASRRITTPEISSAFSAAQSARWKQRNLPTCIGSHDVGQLERALGKYIASDAPATIEIFATLRFTKAKHTHDL